MVQIDVEGVSAKWCFLKGACRINYRPVDDLLSPILAPTLRLAPLGLSEEDRLFVIDSVVPQEQLVAKV